MRVIEQRAVAVGRRLQLLEEPRDICRQSTFTLALLATFSGLVAVVRDDVPRVGDADLRERPLAGLARHHEREHAGEVGLPRHRQQVEHQRRVIARTNRGCPAACRPASTSLCCCALGALDAPLDLAHVVAGSRPTRARSRGAQPRLQRPGLAEDRVEDAAVLAQLLARRSRRSRRRRTAARTPPRGLISIGSGVVGDAHEIVFM